MGEKMQVVGGSPAVCGEGEAASRRPVVRLYLLSFPAPSRAGACGEEGRAVRKLLHPASSWGRAEGHCAWGRRSSGSALGFWGQRGGRAPAGQSRARGDGASTVGVCGSV